MNAISTIMVLWVLFATATVYLAVNKSRNDTAWFTAAMFFGPLALIAIALLPAIKRPAL